MDEVLGALFESDEYARYERLRFFYHSHQHHAGDHFATLGYEFNPALSTWRTRRRAA